ncbi:MAG: SMC family ATPase [Chloroflexi bacterium]|nr:SMC family ATPase [Chloroflexota bacterium]
MVPLKLALRNFMAYRRLEPPLDFTGIHVACLSGPNGAGKSALLDAMTWALWGQARARSDDDLITLGESEMEVELEFGLGEERYRVLRKRTRGVLRRPGQSILELQIWGGDGPSTSPSTSSGHRSGHRSGQGPSIGSGQSLFRPLTGNTLRETQRQIEGLLRLDYQTFINSALLLQGRADEFTLKAPGERKRVLGEVLGLSRYDAYEALAREQARRREGELQGLRAEMTSLEEQVSHREEFESELQGIRRALQEMSIQSKAQEERLRALQEAQRLRAEKQARLVEARARTQQAEVELQEQRQREGAQMARLQQFREMLDQREAIEQGLERYRRLVAADDALSAGLQQLVALREQATALERTVEAARSRLEAQALVLERETTGLREVAARRSGLAEAQQAARRTLAALAEKDAELKSQREALEALAGRIGVLEHSNQEITRQGQEIRAKAEQLAHPGVPGVCPLCGTELGPEGHQRILEEYQGELERQRERYRENDRAIKELQKEQQQRQAGAAALEAATNRERAAAQAQAATAAQGLAEAEKAATSLVEAEARLKTIQEGLRANAYAPAEQQALVEVQRQIAGLGYNQEEHRRVREELAASGEWLAKGERLQEALRRLPAEETELASVREAAARWEQRAAQEAALGAALAEELAALPDTAQETVAAQQNLEQTRSQLMQANAELGRVQTLVDRCRELEGNMRERRRQMTQTEVEKGIYEDLSLAFGRRGVQALLIDAALPELEEEANRLLGRMTDNCLSLRLETQRQTRGGGMAETLDIRIADELGTRAYELYSGGEAFRINFALRVAISKLLARRAGAPLPTLVIDEGFGTQDAAGREKLIEAVNAIAGDFERVLVITHIDELKDAFPVRIEVTKTPEGSRVEVV